MRGELPTYYYHSHFVEMMRFVEGGYGHVLLDDHVAFIRDFERLPDDAQCLYVRLVNRKGKVFATNRLKYPELGDTAPLVTTLREQDWLEAPAESHFDELLRFLTRSELYEALAGIFVGLKSSMKKAEFVAFAKANCSPAEFVRRADLSRLVVQGRAEQVSFLMFLYFGRVQDGLSKFTMRDLGLVRTHSFRESFEPRFADREEALEHYFFDTRLARLSAGDGSVVEELTDGVHDRGPAHASSTTFSKSKELRMPATLLPSVTTRWWHRWVRMSRAASCTLAPGGREWTGAVMMRRAGRVVG